VGSIGGRDIHEILPDKQPQLIAKAIKDFILIHAAAPDPHHVLMARDHDFQPASVHGLVDTGQEIVGWDPVGPCAENVHVVDLEVEGSGVFGDGWERGLDEEAFAESRAFHYRYCIIQSITIHLKRGDVKNGN
jgi:hypothetical protein